MRSDALTRLKRGDNPTLHYLLVRARSLLHYAHRGHVSRRRIIERYLATTEEPRLHIGAGSTRLDGWLNSDLIGGDVYLDLARPLPFRDGALAFVYGEHVISCLTESRAVALLQEAHRVLRPGGILRLTTPDLAKLIELYRDENAVVSRDDYTRWLSEGTGKPVGGPAQLLNDLFRLWGVHYTYDEDDLVAKLREVGFAEVQRVESGESQHAALCGVEGHGEPWVNRAEAMCIEATRA